jgi:hypothetical protein
MMRMNEKSRLRKRVLKKLGIEAKDLTKYVFVWFFSWAMSSYTELNWTWKLLSMIGFCVLLSNLDEITSMLFQDKDKREQLRKLVEEAKK